MTPKDSPRGAKLRKLPSPKWFLPIGLGLIAAVGGLAWLATRPPIQELSYGRFRKHLVAGEILSVRVGAAHLAGTMKGESGMPSPEFQVARIGLERDPHLIDLLEKHLPDGAYASEGTPYAETLAAPLVALAFLATMIFILLRRGGLGSAMAFTRSRHREYGGDEVPITFADVAGVDEAVVELAEVADFLKTPGKFRSLGGRVPKGILLVGPPGTGKTLLARAVAGEANVPFFSLSGSDFMEMYVGVGAARVRSLFEQARAKAPCLVFIDELDAMGKARGTGGPGNHDERDQTLNQLLVAMDGFDSETGIIVLAATNRPETLDAALVRPGRFDRQVIVDRPDLAGRERILQVHARKVPLGEDLDLRAVAAMTPGFVGAELANLVNEAALLAARKGKPSVDRLDFEEGVERVVAGPEKKQRVIRRDEQRRIAYHEAGHALVARSLPGTDPVHKVSIVGRGNGMGGYTMYRPEDERFLHTRTTLLNTLRMLMGGTVAEEIALGEASDGATSDLQRATGIARRMVTEFGMSVKIGRVSYQTEGRSPFLPGGGGNNASWSEQTAREIDLEVRSLLEGALDSARSILEARRDALDAIAGALVEREKLDAAELQAILDTFPGVTPAP